LQNTLEKDETASNSTTSFFFPPGVIKWSNEGAKMVCGIFLFHLSKCRVPASFTNDILRLEAETFSQLTVRLKTAAKS